MKKQQGFTLIEVIAVLVLVGIMAGVAGFGLVAGAQGYMRARENAEIAQKAQMALTRLGRELVDCEEDDNCRWPGAFQAITLPFCYTLFETDQAGVDQPLPRRLNLSNERLTLNRDIGTDVCGADSSGDPVLVDGVSDFTLTWGHHLHDPGVLIVRLVMTHPFSNTDIAFERRVNTRNYLE